MKVGVEPEHMLVTRTSDGSIAPFDPVMTMRGVTETPAVKDVSTEAVAPEPSSTQPFSS